MTILLDEVETDELAVSESPLSVKCSWCGEVIRREGKDLALAMCKSCYDIMMSEFLRARELSRSPHASDR
jgi:Zn finger protein HypA/HybF involved in hydrogenase expression